MRGIGLRIAETAGYAVSITYMISYLKNAELATQYRDADSALCIAVGRSVICATDWLGPGSPTRSARRTVCHVDLRVRASLFGVLMFLGRTPASFLLIIATFGDRHGRRCQNSLAGAPGRVVPELFTANHRASGASLAYQISGDGVRLHTLHHHAAVRLSSAGSVRPCCSACYAAIAAAGGAGHPRDLDARAPAGR